MGDKNIFESNRAAWNEALAYHQRERNNSLQTGFLDPGFTTLNRDCDDVLWEKLSKLDFNGKTIAQLPCNNGRELLSTMLAVLNMKRKRAFGLCTKCRIYFVPYEKTA